MSHRAATIARWTSLGLALACAAGPPGCAPGVDENGGASVDEVLGGTETFAHPEVGWFINTSNDPNTGCTATLIHPRVAITAAHCISDHFTDTEHVLDSGTISGTFRIERTRTQHTDFTVARYRLFGRNIGSRDVALLLLGRPVSSTIATPSRVASQPLLPHETLTVYGYGCNTIQGGGIGVKRRITIETDDNGRIVTNVLCPGDSGGPVLGASGIVAINSTHELQNRFGNPVEPTMRLNVNLQVQAWVDEVSRCQTHTTASVCEAPTPCLESWWNCPINPPTRCTWMPSCGRCAITGTEESAVCL